MHALKHTVTAAVLRTPLKETRFLDEENCSILYVLILFKVWNFIVSFRITYGKTMMLEVLLEQLVVVYWIENLTFIAINKIPAALSPGHS